ncbi:unnamed protein product [Diamesa serratosioi]
MPLLTIYVVTLSLALCECGLLRTPKVYNALITTNENLTPSRAFPVIQPVVQPIFNPIYPGAFFDPYQQFQYQQSPQTSTQEEQPKSPQSSESSVKQQSNEIPQISPKSASNSQEKSDAPSPIPLNEFGLPPSLVPLKKYQPNNYPYNVPFVYDTFGNYQGVQQYPVLPPFNYYGQQLPTEQHQLPPIEQPMFQVGRRIDQQPQQAPFNNEEPQEPLEQQPQSPPHSQPPQSQSSSLSESIKNNANKNIVIPDVAAPPIPFSIKP